MFRGEKTVLFYIGLIILGYSVYQFYSAVWQIASSYLVYAISAPVELLGLQWVLVVPSFVQGVIFLVISLYIMKAGMVKKEPKAET